MSRTGPDGQKGYSWTVTFLSDYLRTFEGDLNSFTIPSITNGVSANGGFSGVFASGGTIAGNTVTATVKEVRKGDLEKLDPRWWAGGK